MKYILKGAVFRGMPIYDSSRLWKLWFLCFLSHTSPPTSPQPVTWLPHLAHLFSIQLLWFYAIVLCQILSDTYELFEFLSVSTCLPANLLESLFFARWTNNLNSGVGAQMWHNSIASSPPGLDALALEFRLCVFSFYCMLTLSPLWRKVLKYRAC